MATPETPAPQKLVPIAPKVQRPVMGALAFAYLKNQDPDRHYVTVSRIDSRARAEYEARGYVQEFYRDGGVQPMGVAKANIRVGEAIELLEGYLFSISNEELAESNKAGLDIMARIAASMRSARTDALKDLKARDREYIRESNYTREEGSGMDHGEIV